MIRLAIFTLVLVPATIGFCILCGLMAGTAAAEWGQRFWSRMIILVAGTRIRADLSALPEDTDSVVILANHQSQMDIPILVHTLSRYKIRFVAKKSLFRIPLFGWAMWAFGHIPIDRSNRRAGMKSMDAAAEKARRGFSPLVFPEGTRNPDPASSLLDFKIGGAILALKCNRPIVPVVMAGTSALMPKGRYCINPSDVLIKALPPLDASRYTMKDREAFRRDMYALMNAEYQKLWRELGGTPSDAPRACAAEEDGNVF